MSTIELSAKNVSVRINGKLILENINLFFEGPALYFIMGANGSGKSTLLKTLAGLINFSGEIAVNKEPISSYSRKSIAKLIGYVWQNPLYGFFEETVYREITFILKNLKLPLETADKYIDFFGIKGLIDRSPFTLSGGEAKRVSISSVIVAEQPIWLMDEPEAEMDYDGLMKLKSLIEREYKRRLIIVATHNTLLAYKLRKTIKSIIFIKDGKIVEQAAPEALSDGEFLRAIGLVPIDWWFS